MNILFYCQHVLGVGHLRRSLAIAEALAGERLSIVSGGPEAPLPYPAHAASIRLPGLRMDENFSELFPVDPQAKLEDVKKLRREKLFQAMDEVRPDIFLVELFPFGRRGFAFELDPLLTAARRGNFGPMRTVVSLRDVLVEKKKKEKYEAWVLDRLNRLFDLLLIHADPRLLSLDETFSRTGEIACSVRYTGYVAATPALDARDLKRRDLGLAHGQKLFVVSAGGGQVGGPLLKAALEAFARLKTKNARLRMFAGPYLDDAAFLELTRRARDLPGTETLRFSQDFSAELAAADASLSMAGYNTTMDLLASGIPAAVWPFAQNREQRMRAARLEQLGGPAVLEDADLAPELLARRMDGLAATPRRTGPPPVDLNGAQTTARLLHEWMGGLL
jgi:predicted glycosyltransferase